MATTTYKQPKLISTEKVKTDGEKEVKCRGMGAAKKGGKYCKDNC